MSIEQLRYYFSKCSK